MPGCKHPKTKSQAVARLPQMSCHNLIYQGNFGRLHEWLLLHTMYAVRANGLQALVSDRWCSITTGYDTYCDTYILCIHACKKLFPNTHLHDRCLSPTFTSHTLMLPSADSVRFISCGSSIRPLYGVQRAKIKIM